MTTTDTSPSVHYTTLRAMIAALAADDPDHAGERNDVGFSGAHGAQGHRLNRYPRWSPAMALDAWDIVRRYRRTQLTGFDWEAAEEEAQTALACRDQDRTAPPAAAVSSEARRPAVEPAAPATAGPSARDILGPQGPIARVLPGYEAREPQLRMADVAERAIRAGRHAVIEAGTGTGKSYAYATAALVSGQSALISTADKGLQAQLAEKDLPFLQAHAGIPFDVVVVKGRGNYLCLERHDDLRRRIAAESAQPSLFDGGDARAAAAVFRSPEVAGAWPAVDAWAETTDSGDLESRDLPVVVPGDLREQLTVTSDECIGDACPFRSECFIERMKARAEAARIVVVNHHLLLLDLAIRASTDGQATVLPDKAVTVIDEAHHIEPIATDVFGVELTEARISRLRRALDRLTVEHPAVPAAAAHERRVTAEQWAALMRGAVDSWNALTDTIAARMGRTNRMRLGDDAELTGPLIAALKRLASEMKDAAPLWLADERERARWNSLRKRIACTAEAVEQVAAPDPDGTTVRYAERERTRSGAERLVLHAKPIDVGGLLADYLWNRTRPETDEVLPVVATSATIATDGDMAYWRERVGLANADELVVPAPFDYRRAGLLYTPEDGRAFDPSAARGDGSLEYVERLTAEIERLILASDGRAFALFTSRRMLNEVHDRLAPRLRFTVLRQGDAPRPLLVEQFKADGKAVLFGLKSFWEGVSIDGEALSLVIIDKLPFGQPDDPVWEARCEAITERTGDRWAWFNQLAIPEAIIALKQGTGRLIRTRTDTGVCAILDGRLRTKGYGKRIVGALPPFTQTHSLDAVRAFFGS